MKRPGLTPKQKQHAREMRALLTLRRAAVRYKRALDLEDIIGAGFLETSLHEAACRYANTLNARERRRLSR